MKAAIECENKERRLELLIFLHLLVLCKYLSVPEMFAELWMISSRNPCIGISGMAAARRSNPDILTS